jgi:AAA+ ATPase superfamily predicted ATPase
MTNVEPQFVAGWNAAAGRRRVGKSALLDAAFDGRRRLSFQADEQDERGQLKPRQGRSTNARAP